MIKISSLLLLMWPGKYAVFSPALTIDVVIYKYIMSYQSSLKVEVTSSMF